MKKEKQSKMFLNEDFYEKKVDNICILSRHSKIDVK